MTLAGLLVAFAAACCIQGGYVLQAFEARDAEDRRGDAPLLVRLVKRPRWTLGLLITIAGTGLQVLALTLAPLTLVQPTLSLGLLLLLALARFYLRERIGAREVAGVLAVLVGVALAAIGTPEDQAGGADSLALAVMVVVLSAGTLFPFALRGRLKDPRPRVLAATIGFALGAITLKLAADDFTEDGQWIAGLAWLALSGLAGVLSLTSEMRSLQRMPATHVAPVIQAGQVLIPVLAAVLVLGESLGETSAETAAVIAGVVLVTAGALILGSSRALDIERAREPSA